MQKITNPKELVVGEWYWVKLYDAQKPEPMIYKEMGRDNFRFENSLTATRRDWPIRSAVYIEGPIPKPDTEK